MNTDLFFMGGGIVLLILATLGGGIEVKEIKVPQLTNLSRISAALVGIGLIVVGVYFRLHPTPVTNSTPTATPPINNISAPAPGAIVFSITDRLAPHQLMEKLEVFLNGKSSGTLEITKDKPIGAFDITVPSAGQYQYRITGSQQVLSMNNEVETRQLTGSGSIVVDKGSSFIVHLKKNAATSYYDILLMTPEEERAEQAAKKATASP